MNHKNKLIFLLFCLLTACAGNKKSQNYFETGKKHEEMQRYDSATLYYRKAIDLLNEKEDSPLKGEIYNRIGDIFIQTSLYPNAYEAYKKGSEYNSDLEDKTNLSKSLRGMGKSCVLQNKLDLALTYFISAFKLSESIKDTAELLLINNNLSNIYLDLKQYDKSLYYNDIALQLSKNNAIIYRNWLSRGDIFMVYRQYDSARYYYELGSHSSDIYTKASCYWRMYELCSILQLPDSSKYLKLFTILNDSLDRSSQTVQVGSMEKKYLKNKTEEEYKKKLGYVSIRALLLVTVSVLLVRRYKKRLETPSFNREVDFIKDQKEGYLENLQKLEGLHNNIVERIKNTGTGCKERFLKTDAYKLIKEQVKKDSSALTKEEKVRIFNIVLEAYQPFNYHLSNFMNMNADDCFLCCLALCGFTTKEISFLRNVSWNAVRSQKTRIKDKMVETFSDLELFEFIFS